MAIDEIATGGGWRFKAGLALLALMALAWLLIPIEAALGMSVRHHCRHHCRDRNCEQGYLAARHRRDGQAGLPGVEGQTFAQAHPGDRRQSYALPDRSRHVLFAIPAGLLETWASHIAPALVANRLWVDALMGGMLIASLFVLGGNFWDKLRAIFVADARAVFPNDASPIAAA